MISRQKILGGWDLADFYVVNDAGAVVLRPAKPAGRLLYTEDGHVAGSMSSATHFLAYFGRYEVHPDRLIHRIDVASDANLVGNATPRLARFEDEDLVLGSSPSILGGPGTTAEIRWRRLTG